MNCGIICLQEYLQVLGISIELHYEQDWISMLELKEILESYQIQANGYYSLLAPKEAPYIIFLPKQKHFMLVKKVGWMVHLFDQNIKDIQIPYVLFLFIYQRYFFKIEQWI